MYSSPIMCTDEPTPAEPKWMLPGSFLASAVSCCRSLAGSAGEATTTCGISASTVTTRRSEAGLYDSFL
ncbi:hypothetical protein D3C78_1466340 [compost metagenome]